MPRNRLSVYKNKRIKKHKISKTRKYKLKGGENGTNPDKELYDGYVRKLISTLGTLGKKNFLLRPQYEHNSKVISLMRPNDPSFENKNWADKAESIKTALNDYRQALYEMYKAKSDEQGEEFMRIKNWTDIQSKVDKDMGNFTGFLASPLSYRIKTIKTHTENLKATKPKQTSVSPSPPTKPQNNKTSSSSSSYSSKNRNGNGAPNLVGLHDANVGLALATDLDFDMCNIL